MNRHNRKIAMVVLSSAVVATFVVSLGYGLVTVSDWDLECLVRVDDAHYNSETAIDSQGRVHVAFRGVGDYWGLCHGVLERGRWNLTVLYSSIETLGGISMVIDSNDRVHMAACSYSDDNVTLANQVVYCTWSGTEWRTEIIETGFQPRSAQLVLDSKGLVHIFYTDYSSFSGGGLRHATRNATGWTTASIPTEGIRVLWLHSSVMDENDRVHFLCTYDAYSGDELLAHDVRAYSVFDGIALDIIGLPYQTPRASLILGPEGAPCIALVENITGVPRYSLATRTAGNWTVEGILPTLSLTLSGRPGIAVDDEERVHLVLPATTSDGFRVYYASEDTDGWNISEVARTSWDNINGCSIAIDADGHVSIFYSDIREDPYGHYLIHATDELDFETEFEPFLSAGLWASAAAILVLTYAYVAYRMGRRDERLEDTRKES